MVVLKIFVGTPHEDFAVRDLGVVGLSLFKLYFSLEVDIPGEQKVLVNIVVQSLHRDAQFRMICEDHIGGLSLFDQWTDNAV